MSHAPKDIDGDDLEQRADIRGLNDEQLQQLRTQLRRTLAAPSEKERDAAKLAAVEQETLARREAVGRSEGAERLVAITTEHAAGVQQLKEAERDLVAAAGAYTVKGEAVNAAYRSLQGLETEARALVDRFGLPGLALDPLVAPALSDACRQAQRAVTTVSFVEYRRVFPAVEEDKHRLRERRSYDEARRSRSTSSPHARRSGTATQRSRAPGSTSCGCRATCRSRANSEMAAPRWRLVLPEHT